MSVGLERKIDRLTTLLEEQEMSNYRQACLNNRHMLRDLVINTVLASVVGYFMFRVMDLHFRPS